MSFHFSAQWIEDYRRDGYVILREVVPPSLIADLRRVSDQGRELVGRAL